MVESNVHADCTGKHTGQKKLCGGTHHQGEMRTWDFLKIISPRLREGDTSRKRWPHRKLTEVEEGKVFVIIDIWHHSGRKHSGS